MKPDYWLRDGEARLTRQGRESVAGVALGALLLGFRTVVSTGRVARHACRRKRIRLPVKNIRSSSRVRCGRGSCTGIGGGAQRRDRVNGLLCQILRPQMDTRAQPFQPVRMLSHPKLKQSTPQTQACLRARAQPIRLVQHSCAERRDARANISSASMWAVSGVDVTRDTHTLHVTCNCDM